MGLQLNARRLHVQLAPGVTGGAVRRLLSIDRFDVDAAQTVALYGPSGSGKTTLLHLLAGLQVLPQAQIAWSAGTALAQDISTLGPAARDAWRLRNAGLVFQQFQLFADMSALDNVLTPYQLDHWRCPAAARLRAQQLLDTMCIPAAMPTYRLSRGEQQRVAIARALVRQPQVVFADEPTASLDVHTAQQVMQLLLQQCASQQITLLVSTHDSTLAPLFGRVLAIRDGQLAPLTPP